jgi:xanthine dehydrogenase YagR molybdenum-binding subunit
MAEGWPKTRRLLGTRVRRLDGPDKATGRAKYSYDINRKGMLHGMILRSPHAHAKIKSIDTSAARKTPGFKALVVIGVSKTGFVGAIEGDTLIVRVPAPKKKGKVDPKDQPKDTEFTVRVGPTTTLISKNKVVKLADLKVGDAVFVEDEKDAVGRELYFAGDEILAVAADTEEHAKDVLKAIQIEFQQLDHFTSEEEVLKNPNKKTTPGPLAGNLDNTGKEATKGDVAAGFEKADAVVEATYGVPVISHQCLETHGLVAEWDADGGLTVWASTQAVVRIAADLAARFGVAPTKVKCITHYMGGGFGSKFSPGVYGFAAADLARRAGAAVKIMLDRQEEITTAGNRPSASGTVKIAGNKDGSITAFAIDCHGTPGYTGGATVNLNLLPYVYLDVIPNWKRSHSVVLINAGGSQAMRAPGHPQNCVLTEFAVDDLAAKLGIDPVMIRRKHLPPNNPKATDKVSWAARRHDVYTEELDIAERLSGWKEKWHQPGQGPGKTVKHGIGMALHTWGGFAAGGTQPNECRVIISRDGTVTAETSTQDLGTAQRTVTAIVSAEILGMTPTDIVVKIGESQYGFSSGSGGSTTCPSQAPAALLAAQAARDDLFKKVAPKVGADPKDLTVEPGKVVDKKNNKEWAWKEFCARLGMDEAKGKGEWSLALSNEPGNENISSGQVGGVQTAEVLVDTETGVVRVTHMVAVQDCGLVVNKLACESQVAGGVIMGLNYGLFEENILDRVTGRQVNPDMEFYKLGGLRDMPKITVHMMDMPDRGVIGIGEPPTISTAAAIGNAVFNALGVRVPFIPLTPKRVLDALAKGGKAK